MTSIGERLRPGGSGLSTGQLIALTGCLIGGAALGWFGFKTAFGDGTATATTIVTQTVRAQNISQTATTSGSIVSQATSKVAFQTAGRVATVNVKQGQSVRQGDVIATLDTTQLQIAQDAAKSQVNTAQANLDSFLSSATPDVVEAARAAIASATTSETTAQNQLTTAQTNKVTAANAVATAQNAVATAQNSAISAADQVLNAQNALAKAQNDYQALLAGPLPQDIAVSQSAVNTARSNLDTAQLNYDRLVNHTDAATRPETTALVTASAAYQAALSALANALPQPANPYDVANQQLAVQTASTQLALAQQGQQSAAQALGAAMQVSTVTPALPTLQNCVLLGDPSSGAAASACSGGSLQSPGTTNTGAVNAVTQAQNNFEQAQGNVASAQASYQKALNDLQKLLNPISTTNFGGQQAQVESARQQLDVARRNYDSYMSLSDLQTRPEYTALKSAQSAYDSALAQLNLKTAPPKDTDLANAQLQIGNAQAALDQARASAATADLAIGNAQLGVTNASASTANSDPAIRSAAASVDSAREGIKSAQAKLDQTLAGPLPSDVAARTESVVQAKLNLQTAQTNFTNATLLAPFSGTVSVVTAVPGDQVATSNAIITLVDTSRVELDAQVDETTFGQIRTGMPVTVRMDALPNQPLQGFITTIVPSGTVAQGIVTFPIVITITTPNVTLPNAATASQISIILQSKQNVLAVQARYIYRDAKNGNATTVDVIKNGKRLPTVVTTGLVTDQATEITSGLKAGDQIALPLKKSGSAGAAFGQNALPLAGGGGPPGR